MTNAKANGKRSKSIDFSKGVRGKYARMKLVTIGPTQADRDKDMKGDRKR